MTARPPFSGKLPNGRVTTNVRVFTKEWQKFNSKVEQALVCQVVGFDPGVLCKSLDSDLVYNLPVSVASRIVYLHEKAFDKLADVC